MTDFIESLNWRYATKKYDASKKVSNNDLETLKEAVQLSVSSAGLQPYRVVVVESDEAKNKLAEAAMGNNKNVFADASHLFIFAVEKNLGDEHVEDYMDNISETRNVEKESLKDFEGMIKGSIDSRNEKENQSWAGKQAYIALSNLINAAAVLKIDSTPMEGFDANKVDEILNLNDKGLTTSVIAAVGYRHSDDNFQNLKKVRKPKQELFITI
ncbi:NAD(P)H-dependent oxidoreductase [Flavobacterium sp.]|uniref:NAD(P)H-dependent oxidoreductase n=1 Tax=Flavobacterium sp. TaxID=239 RepID=UPI002627EEB9|nr:NAD(P)H-dependent oxidoreductase [Flavobacterium sp.]